jgi:oligoribonuclease
MTNKKTNLIWIDLEMTGLDTVNDFILEIATIVTDDQLEIIAEGPVYAIHQSDSALDKMDSWNKHHHGDSGLIERVKASSVNAAQAEAGTLEFLRQHVEAGMSPMCGNSICQDRRFMYRSMPQLESFFHYRNLDVSSLNILVQRWAPALLSKHKKSSTHQALADVKDSIDELIFYRQNFLKEDYKVN